MFYFLKDGVPWLSFMIHKSIVHICDIFDHFLWYVLKTFYIYVELILNISSTFYFDAPKSHLPPCLHYSKTEVNKNYGEKMDLHKTMPPLFNKKYKRRWHKKN